MEELSNAETALLCLLSEKPMNSKEIEQEIQYRDLNFWTDLSNHALNQYLQKLEGRCLIICANDNSSANSSGKFFLTESGKSVLVKKIEKILSNVEHLRWQIDIGTYNCNLLPKKKVIEALSMYRTKLKEKIDGYKDLLNFLQDSRSPIFRLGIASRPIFLLEAEIRWVDSFLKELETI